MIKHEKYVMTSTETEKIKLVFLKHYLEMVRLMELPSLKWPYPKTDDGIKLTRKDLVDLIIDTENAVR